MTGEVRLPVTHTDYGALGCGRFEPGDWTSGHRPETTCPDCRANLIREGGMSEGMFYPTLAEKLAAARVASLVHIVPTDSAETLCGANGDIATDPERLFTRGSRTCPACLELADERAFDRAHP